MSVSGTMDDRAKSLDADPHAVILAPLIKAGDWMALICHGIAHQHRPAFGRAVEILRTANEPRANALRRLADYLTGLFEPRQTVTAEAYAETVFSLEQREKMALRALSLMVDASLDPSEIALPAEKQGPLWQRAIQASQEGVRVAEGLANPALNTFFTVLWGEALRKTGQREQAREVLQQAARLLRQLARRDTGVCIRPLGRVLRALSGIHMDRGDLALARHCCEEALKLQKASEPQESISARSETADMLANLARMHRTAHDLPAALRGYRRAAEIRRELVKFHYARHAPKLSVTLSLFGNVARTWTI